MVDYDTLQRRRNMFVGGFVILAFCAFFWMIFIFGELPIAISQLRSFNILVNFPNAPGVQENTPVKYCGYQIGRVINVSPPFLFTDDKGRSFHQVKVTLAIEREYVDIPENVEVKLMKRSMGSNYIELLFDPDKPITAFLSEETPPLQGSMSISSEFFPKEVQKKLEELVDSISTLADNANDVIGDPDNKANLKKTLANVTTVTAQATETLKSIKKFCDTGIETMKEAAEQLNTTLIELRTLLAKINSGDGSAAKFINDGRLYENLLDSSQELQMALEQFKKLAVDAREKGIKIKL